MCSSVVKCTRRRSIYSVPALAAVMAGSFTNIYQPHRDVDHINVAVKMVSTPRYTRSPCPTSSSDLDKEIRMQFAASERSALPCVIGLIDRGGHGMPLDSLAAPAMVRHRTRPRSAAAPPVHHWPGRPRCAIELVGRCGNGTPLALLAAAATV